MNDPSGTTWCESGNCKQFPTKNVEVLIQYINSGPVPYANGQVCDKFDNRGMVLTVPANAIDPFDAWVEHLKERHLASLRWPEVRRGIQALGGRMEERGNEKT